MRMKNAQRWMMAAALVATGGVVSSTASAATTHLEATGIANATVTSANISAGVVLLVGDETDVEKVEWKIDGERVGIDFDAPFEQSVDLTGLDAGPHTFSAKAKYDTGWKASPNVEFDFSPVTYLEATGVTENEIVSDGSIDAGVNLIAGGPSKVEWKIDNVRFGIDFDAPFEQPLDVSGLGSGTYSLVAKGYYGSQWKTSPSITFEIPPPSGWVTVSSESDTYPKPATGPVKHAVLDFLGDDISPPGWGRERIGFLVRCTPVGTAALDPIVSPGMASIHEHEFFGNATAMTSELTTDDLVAGSDLDATNCSDKNDRSGYWAPTVFQDGVPVPATHMLVYYKSPVHVGLDEDVRMPLGLRMVAGNSMAESNQGGQIGGWAQHGGAGVPNTWKTNETTMVDAGSDGYLEMVVNFPPCWDGLHLDSPDHKSHMAYPEDGNSDDDSTPSYKNANATCPDTHPYRVPQLVTFTKYKTQGGAGLTLSSGVPPAEGEPDTRWASFHQDFWNGFHPDQFEALTAACINQDKNCRAELQDPTMTDRGQEEEEIGY